MRTIKTTLKKMTTTQSQLKIKFNVKVNFNDQSP